MECRIFPFEIRNVEGKMVKVVVRQKGEQGQAIALFAIALFLGALFFLAVTSYGLATSLFQSLSREGGDLDALAGSSFVGVFVANQQAAGLFFAVFDHPNCHF